MLECESMTLPTTLLKRFPNKVFIETGSYDGRTIAQALSCGFEQVLSVELSDEYFAICKERFGNDPRVKLYHDDSCVVLADMLASIDQPATVWLDCHVQENTCGMYPAPLTHELAIITKHNIKTHTILIDDLRLFEQGWWKDITLETVIAMLKQINPNYTITYEDSKAARADIIVAHMQV